MIDEQLTEHFWLHEFLHSQKAARMGIELDPPSDIIDNLRTLCVTLLEPIRVALGRVMTIDSGYRPLWLNVSVGGASHSAHLYGRAADIVVSGMSPATFCRWIYNNRVAGSWPIDQCILEGTWTHLAWDQKPRDEFLTAHFSDQGVSYTQGV